MRIGGRAVGVALACLLLVLGAGHPAVSQEARDNLRVCRRAHPRGDVGGFALDLSECGTRFTAQDRYVAVVVHL